MAHGENAEKHWGREYWSRRVRGAPFWGRVGKWLTHRKERAQERRMIARLARDPDLNEHDAKRR